jgi:hypothetical protein
VKINKSVFKCHTHLRRTTDRASDCQSIGVYILISYSTMKHLQKIFNIFFPTLCLLLLIISVFVRYESSSENRQTEVCEGLVFEIELFERKINNKHQASPRWMLFLKDNLANRWAENKCEVLNIRNYNF